MRAEVWQAKNPTFLDRPVEEMNFPADFELVAEVETNNVDAAYERTNTIHCPWWENEGVKALKSPCRSTSVGDVVLLNGERHLCQMTGWKVF